MYARHIDETLFPRAAEWVAVSPPDQVREPSIWDPAFPWSERHIQCAWYDQSFRPDPLFTDEGEPVVIENPGIWNLEAGPDFLGAALRIGPQQRRICGDVELHIRPADWTAHGHASDPAYAAVRIHVTWFSGAPPADLPTGVIRISLRDAVQARAGSSLDDLDTTAYPYAARQPQTPCHEVLKNYPPERREQFLASMGEARLRQKALRLNRRAQDIGLEQALYEEIMTALGYHRNKAPFRLLARVLPYERLREAAGQDPFLQYALLTGVAGLLPERKPEDPEAAAWHSRLWTAWWKLAGIWGEHALPRQLWNVSGLRPANHPLRRLAAAAQLFSQATPLSEIWIQAAEAGPEAPALLVASLETLEDPFWSHHLSLHTPATPKAVKLIGGTRAQDMVTNIFIPFLAVAGIAGPFSAGLLDHLPLGQENRIIKQTAHTLFGMDVPSTLLRNGLRRQGLLHIFHTCCLDDRSRCVNCNLAKNLT